MWMTRAELESLLCCPHCHGRLEFGPDETLCKACARGFPITDGKYHFIGLQSPERSGDFLYLVKQKLKRLRGLYQFLALVVSPIFGRRQLIRRVLSEGEPPRANLGSGDSRLSDDMINVDVFPYPNVHVVADVRRLPFHDESLGAVYSLAVLEHVDHADRAVAEMYRVLRKGGRVFSILPFIVPFHAVPYDFTRVTLPGLRSMFGQFREIESGVRGGPASAFLWVLQDFVALLLSFGSRRLKGFIYALLTVVTFPIKYLDLVLARLPTASDLAATLYYYGEKE
jgi:SAM-dependent methyltransferase